MHPRPTEICLTIDVEFSIGGAFAGMGRPVAEPAVLCPAGGREHGLGFLLEVFARHGIKATFFVEALNTVLFGPEPMGALARRIHGAGHDVQLHLHPCWLEFRHADWAERVRTRPPNDSCAGRTVEELREFLHLGLAAFAHWGLPRPVALRTGNLQVDGNVHRAMAEFGLMVSSSVGAAHWPPAPELRLDGGVRVVDGVAEVPVRSFEGVPGRRLLTITGTGAAETRALLWRARRAGEAPLVVLTHPFEFVKVADPQYRRLTANRTNQRRLEALAGFLARHRTDFAAVTVAQAAESWRANPVPALPLSAPKFASMIRGVENRLSDLVWGF